MYCKYVLGDIYRKRLKLYKELRKSLKRGTKEFEEGGIPVPDEYRKPHLISRVPLSVSCHSDTDPPIQNILKRNRESLEKVVPKREGVYPTKFSDFVDKAINNAVSGRDLSPVNYIEVGSMLILDRDLGGGYSSFINKAAKIERENRGAGITAVSVETLKELAESTDFNEHMNKIKQ